MSSDNAVGIHPIRTLVARAIAESGPYAHFTLADTVGNLAPDSSGRHVVLAAYNDPTTGEKSTVRLDYWTAGLRVRPFCSHCLSRTCGHALRVATVFRAAMTGDLATLTRYLRTDATDRVTDADLSSRWRDHELAREAEIRTSREAAVDAERKEVQAAKASQIASGADLPLFASTE